jgi:hypothetical protein
MSCDDKGPKSASDCTPCSPGLRNRYFRGKLMTVADYQAEQRYMIQRRRMTSRTVLGWGVASGFAIESGEVAAGAGITIGEGFAIDPHGRELVACEAVEIRSGADLVWLKQGRDRRGLERTDMPKEEAAPPPAAEYETPAEPAEASPPPGLTPEQLKEWELKQEELRRNQPRQDPPKPAGDTPGGGRPVYLLSAHYAERRIDAVIVNEGCGETLCEANRICETVVFSLQPMPRCPTGLPSCPDTGSVSVDADALRWMALPKTGHPPELAGVTDRGPHSTLAEWSMQGPRTGTLCGEPALRDVGGGLAIDPDGGVPLACVTIGFECGDPYVSAVLDARGPRRLVNTNDMLFDLIRGCDLTRIKAVGWSHLLGDPHDMIPFENFEAMFVGGQAGKKNVSPVDTAFLVLFSGPVQLASLSPHVLTITLIHWDGDGAFRYLRRLPIVRLRVAAPLNTDPPDTTRAFLPVVDGNYWAENIFSTSSAFRQPEGTIVEISVRGGMIVDAHGQLVAAGGGYLPSRPGWPGSDSISAFTVRPPASSAPKAAKAKVL